MVLTRHSEERKGLGRDEESFSVDIDRKEKDWTTERKSTCTRARFLRDTLQLAFPTDRVAGDMWNAAGCLMEQPRI